MANEELPKRLSVNRHRVFRLVQVRVGRSPESAMLGYWMGLPDILSCWARHGQPTHETLKVPDKALTESLYTADS